MIADSRLARSQPALLFHMSAYAVTRFLESHFYCRQLIALGKNDLRATLSGELSTPMALNRPNREHNDDDRSGHNVSNHPNKFRPAAFVTHRLELVVAKRLCISPAS